MKEVEEIMATLQEQNRLLNECTDALKQLGGDVSLLAERMGQFLTILEQFAERLGRLEGGSGTATPSAEEIANAVATAVADAVPKPFKPDLSGLFHLEDARAMYKDVIAITTRRADNNAAIDLNVQNIVNRIESSITKHVENVEKLSREVKRLRERQDQRDKDTEKIFEATTLLLKRYQLQFETEKSLPNYALNIAARANGVIK